MRILFLVIAILGFACDHVTNNTKEKEASKDGPVKSYSKDGKLTAEIYYKNGKRDGIGKSYYKNGNVQFEIPYSENKREGIVKRFYEGGRIFQETEFVSDKQTGIQKTYKQNGQLQSEARFEAGDPCTGLKEYLLNGSLKRKYPHIIAKVVDRVQDRGEYIVYLSLSDGSRRVKFYKGELSKTGCVTNRLLPLPYDTKTKRGELKYTLPVGGFLMEEVNIIAEISTLSGNSYIAQKRINIAIKN